MKNLHVVSVMFEGAVNGRVYDYLYDAERMGAFRLGDVLQVTVSLKHDVESMARHMRNVEVVDGRTASYDDLGLKQVITNVTGGARVVLEGIDKEALLRDALSQALAERPTEEVIEIMLNGYSDRPSDAHINKILEGLNE